MEIMKPEQAKKILNRVTGKKAPPAFVVGALKLPTESRHLGFMHKLKELGFSAKDRQRIDYWYVRVKEAHAKTGQTRASGERFFEHLYAVANIYIDTGGKRISQIISLFSHDTVEDTSTFANKRLYPGTYRKRAYKNGIREIGGKSKFRKNIITGILSVTNPYSYELKESEVKMDFVAKAIEASMVLNGPIAFINKLCDRTHNLSTLDAKPDTKQRKFDETVQYLVPLFNRCAEYMEQRAQDSKKWSREYKTAQIVGARFYYELNKVASSLGEMNLDVPKWARPEWEKLRIDPKIYGIVQPVNPD